MRSFKEYDSGDQIKEDDIWGAREQKTIFGRPSYRREDDLTSHETSAAEYNNNETFSVIVPDIKFVNTTQKHRVLLKYAMGFLRILATD
jgi:hypothetical protein